jgi:hypothetical protein
MVMNDPMAVPATRHAGAGGARVDGRGLPVTPLLNYPPETSSHYVVTAVDARGRLADASPVRKLAWAPGTPITLHVVGGQVVVATHSSTAGRHTIIRQGHLRLPAAVRHACRLRAGARVLVAAHPETGVLVVFTTRMLDGVLRACYLGLIGGESETGALGVQGR